MAKITVKQSLKKKSILLTFLILCSLIISGNVFSRRHWEKDFLNVSYNAKAESIIMSFIFYDKIFDRDELGAYLESAVFYFSLDGVKFEDLMVWETEYRGFNGVSQMPIKMKNKLRGADLSFVETLSPLSLTDWHRDNLTRKETVDQHGKASLTIRWRLKGIYKNVKAIAIKGKWNVRQKKDEDHQFETDQILLKENTHDVPYPVKQAMKSMIDTDTLQKYTNPQGIVNQPENNAVKVTKEEDAIIIKGAISGEMINVYSITGSKIKSIPANNEEVKIKLPSNQIYFVHLGQSCHKLVL